MSQSIINLRYLLWRTQAPRAEWSARLSAWAECDVSRAEELLRDGRLRVDEQRRIARSCQISEEDLLFAHLLDEAGVNILQANLAFLTDGLEHGGKAQLAAELGVDASTISRWRAGARPRVTHIQQLRAYFHLPPTVDLCAEPLFLSPTPITALQQRVWLHQRIDALSAATLQELFPALQRLLREL